MPPPPGRTTRRGRATAEPEPPEEQQQESPEVPEKVRRRPPRPQEPEEAVSEPRLARQPSKAAAASGAPARLQPVSGQARTVLLGKVANAVKSVESLVAQLTELERKQKQQQQQQLQSQSSSANAEAPTAYGPVLVHLRNMQEQISARLAAWQRQAEIGEADVMQLLGTAYKNLGKLMFNCKQYGLAVKLFGKAAAPVAQVTPAAAAHLADCRLLAVRALLAQALAVARNPELQQTLLRQGIQLLGPLCGGESEVAGEPRPEEQAEAKLAPLVPEAVRAELLYQLALCWLRLAFAQHRLLASPVSSGAPSPQHDAEDELKDPRASARLALSVCGRLQTLAAAGGPDVLSERMRTKLQALVSLCDSLDEVALQLRGMRLAGEGETRFWQELGFLPAPPRPHHNPEHEGEDEGNGTGARRTIAKKQQPKKSGRSTAPAMSPEQALEEARRLQLEAEIHQLEANLAELDSKAPSLGTLLERGHTLSLLAELSRNIRYARAAYSLYSRMVVSLNEAEGTRSLDVAQQLGLVWSHNQRLQQQQALQAKPLAEGLADGWQFSSHWRLVRGFLHCLRVCAELTEARGEPRQALAYLAQGVVVSQSLRTHLPRCPASPIAARSRAAAAAKPGKTAPAAETLSDLPVDCDCAQTAAGDPHDHEEQPSQQSQHQSGSAWMEAEFLLQMARVECLRYRLPQAEELLQRAFRRCFSLPASTSSSSRGGKRGDAGGLQMLLQADRGSSQQLAMTEGSWRAQTVGGRLLDAVSGFLQRCRLWKLAGKWNRGPAEHHLKHSRARLRFLLRELLEADADAEDAAAEDSPKHSVDEDPGEDEGDDLDDGEAAEGDPEENQFRQRFACTPVDLRRVVLALDRLRVTYLERESGLLLGASPSPSPSSSSSGSSRLQPQSEMHSAVLQDAGLARHADLRRVLGGPQLAEALYWLGRTQPPEPQRAEQQAQPDSPSSPGVGAIADPGLRWLQDSLRELLRSGGPTQLLHDCCVSLAERLALAGGPAASRLGAHFLQLAYGLRVRHQAAEALRNHRRELRLQTGLDPEAEGDDEDEGFDGAVDGDDDGLPEREDERIGAAGGAHQETDEDEALTADLQKSLAGLSLASPGGEDGGDDEKEDGDGDADEDHHGSSQARSKPGVSAAATDPTLSEELVSQLMECFAAPEAESVVPAVPAALPSEAPSGGDLHRLLQVLPASLTVCSLGLSADGRSLLLCRMRSASTAWLGELGGDAAASATGAAPPPVLLRIPLGLPSPAEALQESVGDGREAGQATLVSAPAPDCVSGLSQAAQPLETALTHRMRELRACIADNDALNQRFKQVAAAKPSQAQIAEYWATRYRLDARLQLLLARAQRDLLSEDWWGLLQGSFESPRLRKYLREQLLATKVLPEVERLMKMLGRTPGEAGAQPEPAPVRKTARGGARRGSSASTAAPASPAQVDEDVVDRLALLLSTAAPRTEASVRRHRQTCRKCQKIAKTLGQPLPTLADLLASPAASPAPAAAAGGEPESSAGVTGTRSRRSSAASASASGSSNRRAPSRRSSRQDSVDVEESCAPPASTAAAAPVGGAPSSSICPSYLREPSLRRALLFALGLVPQPLFPSPEHPDGGLDAALARLLPSDELRAQYDLVVNACVLAAAELREQLRQDRTARRRSPMILVLGRRLQSLPWECIPALSGGVQPVVRSPSLAFVVARLLQRSHQSRPVAQAAPARGRKRTGSSRRGSTVSEAAVPAPAVTPSRGCYLLNPSGDLVETQRRLAPLFSQAEESGVWSAVVSPGQAPSPDQFREALAEHDAFVYCGHSSGRQYFSSRNITATPVRATTLLMGCSSGLLRSDHDDSAYEPEGISLSYMIAGCPTLVANLWDVTDGEIDRFTIALLQRWLPQNFGSDEDDEEDDREEEEPPKQGSELCLAVAQSRSVICLPYLVGASPVCYGIPSQF